MGDQTSNKEGLFPRDRPNTEFSLPLHILPFFSAAPEMMQLFKLFGMKKTRAFKVRSTIPYPLSFEGTPMLIVLFLFSFQSDIFGSLNDQGLLSRASEALVAMDMKHPVVSSASPQVFPPIKSDMMYSHPAISSGAGTPISRSNQVSLDQ